MTKAIAQSSTRSNAARYTPRPGGRELAGRKIIKCPHCREMLMDVDRNTKVEIFSNPDHKRKPVKWDKIKFCSACGSKVGYNLILPTEIKA